MERKNLKLYIFVILSIVVSFLFLAISLISIPVGSDPGRVWYFSKAFLDGNTFEAFRTLEPFLSVSVNALFLGTFGLDFPLISIQGVASTLTVLLLTNFLYKNYGLKTAAVSLILFISSYTFLDRSTDLVPYPLFSFLVTLGVLLFVKYVETQEDKYIYLSSVFISSSIFIFNLPITMISIVFFYYVLDSIIHWANLKRNFFSVLKYYSLSAIFLLPWFYWRFSSAGLDFYKNPIHWLGQKYWSKFNVQLWNRPKPLSLEYFDYFLTTGVKNLMGPVVFLSFSWLGLFRVRRNIIFVIWALTPLIPIFLGKLPTEARYLYSSLPPLVILASIGVSETIRVIDPWAKRIAVFLLVLVGIFTSIDNLQAYTDTHRSNLTITEEIYSLKKVVLPGDTIFFRSLQFQAILPENKMIAPQYMQEEDAVNIIAWKNREEVSRIVGEYGIDWFLLYKENKLEEEFNGWIRFVDPELTPRHYIEIRKSDTFILRKESKNFLLYEVRK
jgi:hypothetical protein